VPANSVHEEHVGEVVLRIEADSLGEIFAEAARALFEMMGVIAPSRIEDATFERRIEIEGTDLAGLLVDWLNELILLAEVEKKAFVVERFDELGPRRIRAVVRGYEPDAGASPSDTSPSGREMRAEVKAATWHGVRVGQDDDGTWRARVLLDV
jgi:SHS2 domain-containing protein